VVSESGRIARVLVDVPRAEPLDYAVASGAPAPNVGALCVVPLGARKVVGVVADVTGSTAVPVAKLKRIDRLIGVPPLPQGWLQLTKFAADYYLHGWGEAAIAALPPLLRRPAGPRHETTLQHLRGNLPAPQAVPAAAPIELLPAQRHAVEHIVAATGFGSHLLFGVTGSGKTDVYLEAIARRLAHAPDAQVLLLVPEINLTPQLEARVRARFGSVPTVSLHSGLADRARAAAWLAALEGRARIVLGTRTAVFVPLPRLVLICVDEEHDPSYKAGDGIRYSARDLAVKRAQIEGIPVVLGSATPSIESWAHARAGRYALLQLPERASTTGRAAAGARVETLDLKHEPREGGLTAPVRTALAQALARGEQALVFINRRGYAPILACESCGWLSSCPQCAAFAAFHRSEGRLRCHHCGWSVAVPRACPSCSNQDLEPVGSGTQRIEEALRVALPGARIARLDRDSVRRKHAARDTLQAMHAGDVDVMVGTQMLTKGHDFRRVSVVVVLNADTQLVSHDFRATERLFATLTQVIGRAGRAGLASRALIETRFARHPLLAALAANDYAAFADGVLRERQAAQLPPAVFQALVGAESRTMEAALGFLREIKAQLIGRAASLAVKVYDPVPMTLSRRAGVFRAQLLLESAARGALHALAREVDPESTKGLRPAVRLRIEVDPQEI
jgi:primosomal protein N' (replication factor Y)